MGTFKQMQLVGFKSFADKTVIPLGDGVTCIVGPNGCGKSNVADAIRWVLGEQSAKMMRGAKMEDVIFIGSDTRRKMSFCEVTLTFDNTKRTFDIDCDEVEMTRRLYRDGNSEYLLNKQPSRMRTLTGLLHGAGAAKEGYSIIGQGRIELIMNSKPEDRRSIFEEATGIVVFKDRKIETERKLSQAKDNLYVFLQRMQEVERMLGPLKKASENAIKYRDLYSQLRHHEMNLYISRHDSAAGERDALNKEGANVQSEIDALVKKSDELLAEYQSHRDELAAKDGELEELNKKLRKYEVNLEQRNGESRLFTEKAKALKDKLNSAHESVAYSQKRLEEIEREKRRMTAYAEKNGERLVKYRAETESITEELNVLSKKIADHNFLAGEQRKKVLEAFKDLSKIRENKGSLSAQKEFLNDRLEEIASDMKSIDEKRVKLKSEYEACIARCGELNALLGDENNLLEQAEKKTSDCEEKIQQAVRQTYDLQAQILSLNENLKTYYSLKDRFEGYVYSVKKLLSEAKSAFDISSKIEGLIADVVSCDSEYEVAIETAFGNAMQNVITRTRKDAEYIIEFLKRMRIGHVTFLPIEALRPRYENDMIKSAVKDTGALGFAIDLVKYDKKYENIIHNLLGNTLIVDTLHNATKIATRYPRAFKIVTLSGDVFATSGSMTGGAKREIAGNLLANERQIKECEDSIQERKIQLARAEARKKEYDDKKAEASSAQQELFNKLQSARLELAGISEKQTSLLNSINNEDSEYSISTQSYSAIKQKISELDSEYSGIQKGETDLAEQSDKSSTAIDDMDEIYNKLSAESKKLTEKLNSIRITIASLESDIKAKNDTVTSLTKESETITAEMQKALASIPLIEQEKDSMMREAQKVALSKDEQEIVAYLQRQIEETTKRKNYLNECVDKFDEQRLLTFTKKEDMTKRLNTLNMLLLKIDSDLEYLQNRIFEEYGEEYEGCLKYKEEGYDPTGAPQTIANLKRALTNLGPVNHTAVEEYEELSARHETMVVEKDDMEKAIADLNVVLEDLRTEMLNQFNEGFNIINENFKKTFKELFGGGRAELQLDYEGCDDPLNAGVEIVACPPGKKLAKISLLSGGERALTAIAILFAIIGMRPMPFCVLDEIEAALDEANVARYAKYLKKFATDTQFIVITHRKPTMENADILFGVTMEEKGVSKIVSVKLSEVESKLGGDTVV